MSLEETILFAASSFATIFAIVNPLSGISFFVIATKDYTQELKRRITDRAVMAATITLIVFALAGNYIFLAFGTSIHAFRIAGGILLFAIAFQMVQGERPKAQLTPQDRQEALEKEMIGVVPLGIPMFAGPGAITTVLALMTSVTQPSFNPVYAALVFSSIFLTMGATLLLLRYSDRIFSRIGRIGVYALSRIMGLLLAAVAVQFVILGIQGSAVAYFSLPPS